MLGSAEILQICQAENVASVIPGYGFLSENTDFAEDVVKAGMTWIGPSSDTIKSFGIKHTSRILAEEAGVPIVPGTKDLLKSAQEARQAAEAIGFPVSSHEIIGCISTHSVHITGHSQSYSRRWWHVSLGPFNRMHCFPAKVYVKGASKFAITRTRCSITSRPLFQEARRCSRMLVSSWKSTLLRVVTSRSRSSATGWAMPYPSLKESVPSSVVIRRSSRNVPVSFK